MVQKAGVHHFCFTNKSPYHETIDFDVHSAHFTYYDEHAKDGESPFLVITLFEVIFVTKNDC